MNRAGERIHNTDTQVSLHTLVYITLENWEKSTGSGHCMATMEQR